jgi:hypothetical protein
MKERLFVLFWEDRSARTKIYYWAFSLSLLFGLASFATGASESETVGDGIVVCLITLLFSTVVYCIFTNKQPVLHPEPHLTRRLAFATSIAAIAAAMGLSGEDLEAAVINQRLRRYEENKSLEPSPLAALTNALEYVQNNRLTIDPLLVTRVGQTILATSNATKTYTEPVRVALENIANTQSLIRAPKEAATVGTATVRPKSIAPTPGTVWRDSTFFKTAIDLDDLIVERCGFNDCQIVYSGGSLRLVACVFNRCKFQIANSPNGYQLLSILAESNKVTAVLAS